MAGAATAADADELIHFSDGLLKEVEEWLVTHHPALKPD